MIFRKDLKRAKPSSGFAWKSRGNQEAEKGFLATRLLRDFQEKPQNEWKWENHMSSYKGSELTEQIIQCAYEVHNVLGHGFLEKVYEKAMLEELQSRGIGAEAQTPVVVQYKGKVVGEYMTDILVQESVILELKAVDKILDVHEVQLKNYLKATNIELGLLINFGKSVEVRRKYVANEP